MEGVVAVQEGLLAVRHLAVVPHLAAVPRLAAHRLVGLQVVADLHPQEVPVRAQAQAVAEEAQLHPQAAVPQPALAFSHRTAEATTVAARLSLTELVQDLHQASHRSISAARSPLVLLLASAAHGCTASTHIPMSILTSSTTTLRTRIKQSRWIVSVKNILSVAVTRMATTRIWIPLLVMVATPV